MHIFLHHSSERQRSVVISPGLIPMALQSCIRLKSEIHFKLLLFKEFLFTILAISR